MSDEAFIRAIQASPHDTAAPLIYADWLEERGDTRGECLRLVSLLGHPEVALETVTAANQRLEELVQAIDPGWLTRVVPAGAWQRYHWRTFALLGERPTISK